MTQTCVCFPGMCRGGQVVNGKTPSGSTCREWLKERPKAIRLGSISIVEAPEVSGLPRQFSMTRHDCDAEGMNINRTAIAAMFDRIVELERQLGGGEIPVPCNLRPSHDEQTDDYGGLPRSEEC